MAQPPLAEGTFHGVQYLAGLERLEDVVLDAEPKGLDSDLLRAVECHQDHRDIGTPLLEDLEHLHAGHAREVQVEENEIGALLNGAAQTLLAVVGDKGLIPVGV